jgi:biotin carboxyl carrier protein
MCRPLSGAVTQSAQPAAARAAAAAAAAVPAPAAGQELVGHMIKVVKPGNGLLLTAFVKVGEGAWARPA